MTPRITPNKVAKAAADAHRLLAGIDRLQLHLDGMLANPLARHGRVVRLLATARSQLFTCRLTLGEIDQVIAVDRPTSVDEAWPTAELIVDLLRRASDEAREASRTLSLAADTVTR